MVVPIWTLSSSTPYGCMHIHFSDILFSKKAIKNSPIGTFSGPSMSQHAAQSCSTCVFNNRVGVHVMRAWVRMICWYLYTFNPRISMCDVVWVSKLLPHKMSLWEGRNCVDIYSPLQAYQKTTKLWPSPFFSLHKLLVHLYRAEPFRTFIFQIRVVKMEKIDPQIEFVMYFVLYIGLEGIRNFQVTL